MGFLSLKCGCVSTRGRAQVCRAPLVRLERSCWDLSITVDPWVHVLLLTLKDELEDTG